jgi:hypothetical protein
MTLGPLYISVTLVLPQLCEVDIKNNFYLKTQGQTDLDPRFFPYCPTVSSLSPRDRLLLLSILQMEELRLREFKYPDQDH